METQQDHEFPVQLANAVRRWGLALPAVLLLEAHRPFTFVLSQMVLVTEPLLDLFIGQNRSRRLAELLEDDDQIEKLLLCLDVKR